MMYSKKVMEQFQKTDNHGEIENADGIGKVGNYYKYKLVEKKCLKEEKD